jgi:membrane protein required for beta-lactamase induction
MIVNFLISLLHAILPVLFAIVLLFSYNIFVLGITGIMLFFILISNYILGDCAITLMEDKYNDDNNNINSSMIDLMANNTINLFGNKYSKNDRSLVTLELLWIALILIMIKILILYILIALQKNETVKKIICIKS